MIGAQPEDVANFRRAVALEVAQGEDVAFTPGQAVQQMLDARLHGGHLLLARISARRHLVSRFQGKQGELRVLAPVVSNEAAGGRVEPASHARVTASVLEPAQRFKKDRAGQVFRNHGLVHLPVDVAVEVDGLGAKDGLQMHVSLVVFSA